LDETRLSREQIKIWILVSNAQASAFDAAHNGTVAESVDAAARKVITDAGFGAYFTHRLGHGIGIETHEGPYLVGGSKAVLAPGNTFSDEPGVYIEGKLGVRLEDCFYIGEDGKPVYLTEGAGGPARIMWKP
jgi:Xaa-Pro aminopeptidase